MKNLFKSIDGNTYFLLDFEVLERFHMREPLLKLMQKANKKIGKDIERSWWTKQREAIARIISSLEDPTYKDNIIDEKEDLEKEKREKIKEQKIMKKHEEKVYKTSFENICLYLKENYGDEELMRIICASNTLDKYKCMKLSVGRTYIQGIKGLSYNIDEAYDIANLTMSRIRKFYKTSEISCSFKDEFTGIEITMKKEQD